LCVPQPKSKDDMDNETTPTLNKGGESDKKTYEERLAKKEEQFARNMKCIMYGCLSFIVLLIVLLVLYFIDCSEERDRIDDKPTTVSEKLKDYILDTRANCTNQDPCIDWKCDYVKEHFHRTNEECEYDDYSDWVWYVGIGLLICAICNCLCGKKETK